MDLALLLERVLEAKQDSDLHPELHCALARWEGFTHTVWADGAWRPEGFVTYFMYLHDLMRAVDPGIAPGLPPQCFDWRAIERLFDLPPGSLPAGTAGVSGQAASPQSTAHALEQCVEQCVADIRRIADHFDPPPPDKVGTPYVAGRLGCTTVWVAEMVRQGEIPTACLVPGTGNGKPWKFFRDRIDRWIQSR